MKILVSHEFSGIARDAFIRHGHDAISCDLLASERPGPHHQGDVWRFIRGQRFDLWLAHPECTYLCNSGVRWLQTERGRWEKMEKAARQFRRILNSRYADRIIVENPIMHGHAKEIIGRKQDQVLQPWMFGEPETKAVCLWLKNVDPFEPTDIVAGREARVHKASPGPDRWKERSRSYPGMMDAIAKQVTERYGI